MLKRKLNLIVDDVRDMETSFHSTMLHEKKVSHGSVNLNG